jgi:hypothetical protein
VTLETTSGLAAVYGSRNIPKSLQAKIDQMFEGAGLLPYKEIGRGETAATRRAEADSRDQANALLKAESKAANDALNAGGVALPGPLWTSADEIAASAFTDMGLDDFIQYNAQTLQDLGNCYAGIEYLRHLEGEKHLVFVTERGMYLPRVEDDKDLAAAASDARVAIDTFQTGGMLPQVGGAVQSRASEAFAWQALRNISELTGGLSAIGENGMSVVTKLNDATLSGYVLGYYPSLARFDGSYRKITVKVNRPHADLYYRHGYFARRDIGPFDRRSFITRDRIEAAFRYPNQIRDIKLKLNASLQKAGTGYEVVVNLLIDPATIATTTENGVHVGCIDIAMVFADQKGQVMGQNYQRADLKIAEENWVKMKAGIPYNARVEINPGVRNVRVVVYDYKIDMVGSADKTVF